ncbi:hypothetical protein D3C80_1434630 [compost metagenome]
MRIGVLVVGVDAGEEGMKALALLGRQLLVGMRDQHIGGAVPIGIGIIAGVIARALGFVLVPFLRHRDTREHYMLDIGLGHALEQLVHAGAFLEKIDIMQMGIAVDILASLDSTGGQADEKGATQTQCMQFRVLLLYGH